MHEFFWGAVGRLPGTGSNEPGQAGSAYGPQDAVWGGEGDDE